MGELLNNSPNDELKLVLEAAVALQQSHSLGPSTSRINPSVNLVMNQGLGSGYKVTL